MPSRVSAHRLSGASETWAPQGAWSKPPGHVGVERVLAGVAARAVPAVVAEGDGLGEGHVEPAGPGDAGGDLGHLEGVGEAGALVVLGEDEDLGLAGQAAEGRWRAGCGRGRARSRCATRRAPRARHAVAGVRARVAPGARSASSSSSRAPGRPARRLPPAAGPPPVVAAGPDRARACESAWARPDGPGVAGHGRRPPADCAPSRRTCVGPCHGHQSAPSL